MQICAILCAFPELSVISLKKTACAFATIIAREHVTTRTTATRTIIFVHQTQNSPINDKDDYQEYYMCGSMNN